MNFHRLALRPALLTAALLLGPTTLAGCILDLRPSYGECVGDIYGSSVFWDIEPELSHFYRDDLHFGAERAFFDLSYGTNHEGVAVDAKFADMPDSRDAGVYFPESDPFIQYWYTSAWGVGLGAPLQETLILDETGRTRLVGSWEIDWGVAGYVSCDFDLRRAYELDTDD